jgi:hypothetical protein
MFLNEDDEKCLGVVLRKTARKSLKEPVPPSAVCTLMPRMNRSWSRRTPCQPDLTETGAKIYAESLREHISHKNG